MCRAVDEARLVEGRCAGRVAVFGCSRVVGEVTSDDPSDPTIGVGDREDQSVAQGVDETPGSRARSIVTSSSSLTPSRRSWSRRVVQPWPEWPASGLSGCSSRRGWRSIPRWWRRWLSVNAIATGVERCFQARTLISKPLASVVVKAGTAGGRPFGMPRLLAGRG